ncbi:unnamed protein product [Allacma fusca]|uniref:Kazal-like domain-containing protein n=1 Tax=Allacma fusca TaxID=39272 RepID=A0A8J2Q796_9HEXA|nr:unnamed protein product [Allacma fusca]
MKLAIILTVLVVFTICNENAEAQNCDKICARPVAEPFDPVCDNKGTNYGDLKELNCQACREPEKGIRYVKHGYCS